MRGLQIWSSGLIFCKGSEVVLGGEVVQEPLPVSFGVATPSSTSGDIPKGKFLYLHPNLLELVQLVP